MKPSSIGRLWCRKQKTEVVYLLTGSWFNGHKGLLGVRVGVVVIPVLQMTNNSVDFESQHSFPFMHNSKENKNKKIKIKIKQNMGALSFALFL